MQWTATILKLKKKINQPTKLLKVKICLIIY